MENFPKPQPPTPKKPVPRPVSPARPKVPLQIPRAEFIVTLPAPTIISDEATNDDWTLRCVCEEKMTTGFLVQCDKCSVWQHGICVNLNPHTIPSAYLCEKCANRPIRCKCNNNLNYQFSLIQCTQCGFYVHKRCAGLLYGPLPEEPFVCSYCGRLPTPSCTTELLETQIPSWGQFTFSQECIDSLPLSIHNSPFFDFLSVDSCEQTLDGHEFLQLIYQHFRSFLFLCHPFYPEKEPNSVISKRKKSNLYFSFWQAIEFLMKQFYNVDPPEVQAVIDTLLTNDIYIPYKFDPDTPENNGLDFFSENARLELPNIQMPTMPREPTTQQLLIQNDSLLCTTDLIPDQFICFVDGFVGDLEEFSYDKGVDQGFFHIHDTRLVLDSRWIPGSPIHALKRSSVSNTILKLFQCSGSVLCGLFVGRNKLGPYPPEETFAGIPAGQPLTFAIDFLPALLDEPVKWSNWHFSDDPNNDGKSKKFSDKKKLKDKTKTIPSIKKKSKNFSFVNYDFSLFDLFDMTSPRGLLFNVMDEESLQRAIAQRGYSAFVQKIEEQGISDLTEEEPEPEENETDSDELDFDASSQDEQEQEEKAHEPIPPAPAPVPSPTLPPPVPVSVQVPVPVPVPVRPPSLPQYIEPPQPSVPVPPPPPLSSSPPLVAQIQTIIQPQIPADVVEEISPPPTPREPEPAVYLETTPPIRPTTPTQRAPSPVPEEAPVTEPVPPKETAQSPLPPSPVEPDPLNIFLDERFDREINELLRPSEFVPLHIENPIEEMMKILGMSRPK